MLVAQARGLEIHVVVQLTLLDWNYEMTQPLALQYPAAMRPRSNIKIDTRKPSNLSSDTSTTSLMSIVP